MAAILIIDDSRTSRKVLRMILEQAGHTIVGEAADGKEGIDKYMDLQPDIVTMDITMPVLDGIEALKEIMIKDSSAKVIMVTAAGQKNNIVDAVKYGAAEFIVKPYEAEQISEAIIEVLK